MERSYNVANQLIPIVRFLNSKIKERKLTKLEIALRLGIQPARLTRILRTVTINEYLDQMSEIANLLGYKLEVRLVDAGDSK